MSYREETLCTKDIQNILYADDQTVVTEFARDLQFIVNLWTEDANDCQCCKDKDNECWQGDENQAAITMREYSLEAVQSRN